MNKNITRLLIIRICGLILIAGLFLTACSDSSSNMTTIKDQDSGKTIELKTGQKLDVTLEGNITTGYTWENTLTDTSVLKQNGDTEFKADSNAVGSGGIITLHFDAVAPGKADLTLVYHRPWEKGIAPIKTYQVTVNVK